MTALTLNLDPVIQLTNQQFYQLCQVNPEIKFERTAKGALIVMPPTGGGTGNRNIKLSAQLEIWTEQDGSGVAFDSSTMFQLPNGAHRSPDAAWISLSRWETLTPEDQETFPLLCPDFVVELRSPSDSLRSLQAKMQEYLENGAHLGWLIDSKAKQVEIYRRGQAVEVLESPVALSGEEVLPGFGLELGQIFN